MNNDANETDYSKTVGVLLAGGLSRRFGGGDKCLQMLGEKTLLRHVLDRAQPQTDHMILNAAGNPERFSSYELNVVPDCIEGKVGPLAGVLTGLQWAKANTPHIDWVMTFATDAPFMPLDLVPRLLDAAQTNGANIVMARSLDQVHPVFALWHVGLSDDLQRALCNEGLRKVILWAERQRLAFVDFSSSSRDPFFNINTREDLAQAATLIDQGPNHDPQ